MTLERYLRALTYDLQKSLSSYELVFRHTYSYYADPLVSFSDPADQLLVQTPILLKHVLQEPLSLYSICTVLIPVDPNMYLGNSHEYSQVHVQHPYIAMPHVSYVPLTKPQFNLCTHMGVVYYCKNAHLLMHRSKHTCVSTIYCHVIL